MLGLATIGKHDGEVQMSARPRPTQSELLDEDLSFLNPSVKAPAIRLADLKKDQFLSGRLSLGNLDPLGRLGKLDPLAFTRYLLAFFIGVTATLAWESYGGGTREMIAPAASSPDQSQLNAISLDLEAVRQSIDRIATSFAASQEQMRRSVDQLAAGQKWMTRDFNGKLQTVEQDILDKISAPPPRPAPAPARTPVLRPSPAPIPLTPAKSP